MEKKKKMWEERKKNEHKTTSEELAEEVLSMCKESNIPIHQLMLALQKRIDLV